MDREGINRSPTDDTPGLELRLLSAQTTESHVLRPYFRAKRSQSTQLSGPHWHDGSQVSDASRYTRPARSHATGNLLGLCVILGRQEPAVEDVAQLGYPGQMEIVPCSRTHSRPIVDRHTWTVEGGGKNSWASRIPISSIVAGTLHPFSGFYPPLSTLHPSPAYNKHVTITLPLLAI